MQISPAVAFAGNSTAIFDIVDAIFEMFINSGPFKLHNTELIAFQF